MSVGECRQRLLQTKAQFLRYAGRYVRRSPIAQHRFAEITDREVRFLDEGPAARESDNCVFDPGVRSGSCRAYPRLVLPSHSLLCLLAPGCEIRRLLSVFALLRHESCTRPIRLPWRNSLRKYFNSDPSLIVAATRCIGCVN